MHFRDLMEPEETVGNLWHGVASGIGADMRYPEESVTLSAVRPSLAVLFRALGGAPGVELAEVSPNLVQHRQVLRRKLGSARDREWVARFDGERLGLPPVMEVFPEKDLNHAAYFWLTAVAAVTNLSELDLSGAGPAQDCTQIRANAAAADRAYRACPGLRDRYTRMIAHCAKSRPDLHRPPQEGAMEQAVLDQLCGRPIAPYTVNENVRGYMSFGPVPIWLRFVRPGEGSQAASDIETDHAAPPPNTALSTRKLGERKDQDQQNRKDSFIIHRFESILSWVESMNINRSVDDDDDENAQKAADDQDRITLSKHDRKIATRLRLHVDLSPADADHEALAGEHTYPEWNHRSRSYMENHCRVLDAPARAEGSTYVTNERHAREVRRQFEALRPRRVLQPRQINGQELDLDAVLTARADMAATGRGSDRIWQSARQMERDVSVAFLVDTSRSTEAAIGDTSVIDVARDTMAALAGGIEDSHMAVREARNAGQSLHGVIIDEVGQDWFARIFGRGGFTLLPNPERLLRALPDIYRTLTQET